MCVESFCIIVVTSEKVYSIDAKMNKIAIFQAPTTRKKKMCEIEQSINGELRVEETEFAVYNFIV